MRYFFWVYMGAAFFFASCAIDMGSPDGEGNPGLFEGEDCSLEDEPWNACVAGFSCSSVSGTCVETGLAGTISEDEACSATVDCAFGLACANDGTCQAEGSPGTAGVGDSCDESTDCQAFLTCEDKLCEGMQIPFWSGVECETPPSEEEEDIKVYFEVPGYNTEDANRASQEFYRLPFPNDIRLKDGHIDLSGHPDPGILVEELGDLTADYFDVIENDLDGFGTQSAVFFRMNYYPLNDSMKLNDTIYLLNIDPESPDYGKMHDVGFRASSERGKYICKNWIAVLPPAGVPLAPNTTYAAILTTGITDKDGNALQPDDDFKQMLESSEPSDDVLAAAWQAYQPLRDYLALEDDMVETPLAKGDPAAAAVFTTSDPTRNVRMMRQSVRLQELPETDQMSIDDSDALFTLEKGTVTVPFYQEGTRPFATVAEGGAVVFGSDGLPELVDIEAVKYALSIPTGEPLEGSWPVVIYAHGTFGSERSFVEDDIAARMATVGAAVISLEQPQHGDRRGLTGTEAEDDTYSPENMFYNFLNPRAARDNNLQAAADLFQTVRFIERRAEEEGLLNAEKIYFFGHSQGTQGSFIGAAYEPGIKGFILSGAGGFLIESFLGKKNPVDATTAIKVALMDEDVTREHPVLNLVQAAFDSVDPVNFADAIFVKDLTEDDISQRSIFMSSGMNDTYTPENTQRALARALRVKQSVTSGEPLEGIAEIELPYVGGNVTTVVVRYEPEGDEDGHFVMFDNEDAILQTDYFIQTMLDPGQSTPILESPDALPMR